MLDKDQFLEEFVQYKDMYYRIALSYLKNPDEAADAVCEMSLKAWEHRFALINKEAFRSWTVSILINHCRIVLRRRKYSEKEKECISDLSGGIDEQIALREAVDKLPVKYRDVIILRYYNGFDIKSVAEALRLPLGTVKSRLNRAHIFLRKEFGDLNEKA